MKPYYILFIFILSGINMLAQTSIIITSDVDPDKHTQFNGIPGTQISFTGDFINSSNKARLGNITLNLIGEGDQKLENTEAATDSLAVSGLFIGGGDKRFTGNWYIKDKLTLDSGLIVPQGASKIVSMITNLDNISVNPDHSSYVNGIFYSKGTSQTRLFPVGTVGNNGGYFPSQLASVTQADLEIGMRVVTGNAAFTHGAEITDVYTGQYWELVDASSTLAGPKVVVNTLRPRAEGFILPDVGTVVIGGAAIGGAGISLGGALADDLLVGENAITTNERIFTIAKVTSDQIDVKIHNVITPYMDNANDYLQIDNIHLMTDVRVRLLDRWGVQVREWNGFQNISIGAPIDPSYDLSKLNTGNYICILEYTNGSSREQQSQMITLINQ